jgi:predicted phosphodiesterase
MKIAVCSDLHLEFGNLELKNTENADVLILSGDILVAADLEYFQVDGTNHTTQEERGQRYYDFIKSCCAEFPNVLMVMGNHEHYHGDFAYSVKFIRQSMAFDNFHLLDKEYMIINDHVFFGGSLWTDMNGEDVSTMRMITSCMNDYRIINNSNRMVSYKSFDIDNKEVTKLRPGRFSPEDSVEDHKAFLNELKSTMDQHSDMPFIVVGHHAPSKSSTHPRYKNEVLMNGAYSSDMNEFILNNRQIKVWTHGHTHEVFDYMIGTTRIVCNPRGYINHEERADDFELKFLDV